jgi:molecular chaperone GrpE (heat shock protein)
MLPLDDEQRCSASTDLSEEWNRACLMALGLEGWKSVPPAAAGGAGKDDGGSTSAGFHLMNLLPGIIVHARSTSGTAAGAPVGAVTKKNHDGDDPWMHTARQVRGNITAMKDWIGSARGMEYISLPLSPSALRSSNSSTAIMTDEEASLFESTVASFTATTANEIELLRQCIVGSSTKQQQQKEQQMEQHCAAIVQILMQDLKEHVAEPFGRMQKLRRRLAVEIWNAPLQCRLYNHQYPRAGQQSHNSSRRAARDRKNTDANAAKSAALDLLDMVDDERDSEDAAKMADQRFQPRRESHRLHRNFLKSYEDDGGEGSHSSTRVPPQRPPSLFLPKINDEGNYDGAENIRKSGPTGNETTNSTEKRPRYTDESLMHPDKSNNNWEDDDDDRAAAAEATLHRESVLLRAVMHGSSELDTVQQMEQSMVNITALLSQFADLVSEQQENVWDIRDSAQSTKENVDRGQENLVDARDRTGSSKHYMATGITAMGILLLVLNFLVR